MEKTYGQHYVIAAMAGLAVEPFQLIKEKFNRIAKLSTIRVESYLVGKLRALLNPYTNLF